MPRRFLYNFGGMWVRPPRYFACLIPLLAGGLCLAQNGTGPQAEFASHIRKAETFLHENQPALAIPELVQAVAINPQNVGAQADLGVLLYFQGKPDDAIPHLRVAVQEQPALSKIQGILGIAEVHALDLVQGQKDLEAAFPHIEELKFKLQVGLELVSLYTQSSDLEQAAAILDQLRKAAPDNPEVLYASYRTYADLSAQSMLSLSLVAPDSAQMHQLLAHEEIRQGNTNAAVAQFRKAIALNPALPGIHFELAELLNTSPDQTVKKEAEQEYRLAVAQNPQDEKSICRLGEIAAQRGAVQQAYDEFTKAVALRPDDSDARLDLAKTLIDMNQPAKAQALLEQTVQLDPTNVTAHYRLATFYREQGRMNEARQQLELYQKLRQEKDKLRAVYKDLLIQPSQIQADLADDK